MPRFELAVLILILAQCVLTGTVNHSGAVYGVNFLFLTVYSVEMALRSIAYGFVNGDRTYLRRSIWNAVSSFLSLFVD